MLNLSLASDVFVNCLAQVNKHMPFTCGESSVHVSHIDYIVSCNEPLHEYKAPIVTDHDNTIGKLIAENLVGNGATIQMGIGSIPSVVLTHLNNHKDLGIHTEMFTDGLIDLVNASVVTNSLKHNRPGKIVTSFVVGTRKIFDFIDNNPLVDVTWTNSPFIIAQNPQPISINSCIEVDITGQVVSGSIGNKIYSGFGGQIDFIRGASTSFDGQGKAILAMHSITTKNKSKIVPYITHGAGVVVPRGVPIYIVTEYGITNLFGKSLRQRAFALIQLAHPSHREALEKAAFERLNCLPSPD